MDYKNIEIPFLGNREIKIKADLFRKKFWDDSFPVDIEKILDVKLNIDIIPIKKLNSYCDTDALITSDWKSVYVDYDKFLDDRYQNRLRFSLAHELGHFILHAGIYNGFKISGIEDFYRFIKEISMEQYGYLEVQANKFSNYLLVPREVLAVKKRNIIKKLQNNKLINFENIDEEMLNSYIAKPISNYFGVSAEVAEIALSSV